MGSLPGSSEIVESEMNGGGSGVDEKVGKLPKLKTGRNCALEDDLNHIFEAIDRRTAARNLSLSQQLATGGSGKNASKRPVRVGTAQASGIGISESASLKQALRGLCISHASEMATMKRSSKVIGLSEVSEAGALERMYRSVVVEAKTSDLPLDERKGNLVEISLVPEKSESKSSEKIRETVQLQKNGSLTPRAQSSTQIRTSSKAKLTNMLPLDESTSNAAQNRETTPSPVSKLKCPPSVSSSDPADEAPELAKAGRKNSALELLRKGQLHSSVHSSSSSKTTSIGSNSASNSPRLFIPVAARPTTPKRQHQRDIIPKPTSSSKVNKSPCRSPRPAKPILTYGITTQPIASKTQSQDELLQNSVSRSPRLFTPRPATPKMPPQKEVIPKPTSSSKASKSPSNSPRLVRPVVTNGISAMPKASKTQPQDEIVRQSASYVGQRSTLKLPPKGNSKRASSPSSSNTIKKVLEIEEFDPSSEEAVRGTSMLPKVVLRHEASPAPSSSVSDGSSKVRKFGSSSPRVMNLVSKHTKFVKNKLKRGTTSASSSSATSTACSGTKKEDIVPDTNNLVCQTHKSSQKSTKKESASPASSSRSLSVEVSSNTIDSAASKCVADSNSSCVDRAINLSASSKSRLRDKGNISQSSKSSSVGEYSCSTSISEDSSMSTSSCSGSRPHMSTDPRWDAVRSVKMRYGPLGLKNFKLLKRLGCGDIGTVYLAELTGTNCLFALKVMDSQFLASRRKLARAQTEREILQMLDHPFLPTLYAHFTTDKFSCLVMEYCPGGDLHVVRQKQPNRSFSEHAARFYVAEVLLALEYLHMLGVVYRDLKPENILVRGDGHIMLSDFDLSLRCVVSPTLLKSSSSAVEPPRKLSGPCAEAATCIDPFCIQPSWVQVSCFSPRLISGAAKTRKLKADVAHLVRPLPQLLVEPTSARSNSFVGTHEYLAPEIIKGDGHGSAVDWWTFGIFLYELLFGRTPFKGPGNEETLVNVVLQSLKFPENPVVSFQAKDLIRGLLVKEPENRFGSIKGAAEIKQHPFFEGMNWALIRCAVPPELPKPHDLFSRACQKDDTSAESRNTGEQVEFELF